MFDKFSLQQDELFYSAAKMFVATMIIVIIQTSIRHFLFSMKISYCHAFFYCTLFMFKINLQLENVRLQKEIECNDVNQLNDKNLNIQFKYFH